MTCSDTPDIFQCDRCIQRLSFTQMSRNEAVWASGKALCQDCVTPWEQERTALLASLEERAQTHPYATEAMHPDESTTRAAQNDIHHVIATWHPHWRECMETYLQRLLDDHSASESTLANYAGVLTRFFSTVTTQPEAITRRDCDAFIHAPCVGTRNHGKLPQAATRNQRASILSSFYTFAAAFLVDGQDGEPTPVFRSASPLLGLKRGKPAKVLRYLTADELKRFFAAIPTVDADGKPAIRGCRDKAIMALLFFTARRRGEIMSLVWGDIEATSFPDGNGGRRPAYVLHWRGKGRQMIDDVDELPGQAAEYLLHYLQVAGRLEHMTPDSPLFLPAVSHAGGLPRNPDRNITGSAIWYSFHHYCELAGLEKPGERKFCLHGLRHTSARERVLAGESLMSLSAHLRHRSTATTATYVQALTGSEDRGGLLLMQRFADL